MVSKERAWASEFFCFRWALPESDGGVEIEMKVTFVWVGAIVGNLVVAPRAGTKTTGFCVEMYL